MAIQITDLHRKQMIEEVQRGVLNMQRDVHNNALQHKQWAIDEMPLEQLQEYITNTINAYEANRSRMRYFRDVIIPSDPGFLTVGDALMLTLQSVGVVGQEVADHIDTFAEMPMTNYEEIIAACNYLIDNVNSPPTIWT